MENTEGIFKKIDTVTMRVAGFRPKGQDTVQFLSLALGGYQAPAGRKIGIVEGE